MIKKKIFRITAALLIMAVALPWCGVSQAKAASMETVAANAKISATELYMREGPGTEYENIYDAETKVLLTKGQEVFVSCSCDGWYYLTASFNGKCFAGYSKGTYVALNDGVEVPEQTTAQAVNNSGKVNVRKGPGTKYDMAVAVLPGENREVSLGAGSRMTVVGKADGWYNIRLLVDGKGATGYCYASYVQLESGTEPTADYPVGAVSRVLKTAGTQSEGTGASDSAAGQGETGSGSGDSSQSAENSGSTAGEKPAATGGLGVDLDTAPDGYRLEEKSFKSKFNYLGTVTADQLNMRKSATKSSSVISILGKGTRVMVISSTITAQKENNEVVNVRWYKIVAETEGGFKCGYVMSDYICFDDSQGITVKTKYKTQYIRKKPSTTASKVKDANGKAVKPAKGTVMTILSETTVDGQKFFKVSFEYKGKKVKGYLLADRVSFITVSSEYTVKYLVKTGSAENTGEKVEQTAAQYSFAGANAVIRGASGLTLKSSAAYSASAVMTSGDRPVLLYSGDSVQVLDVISEEKTVWAYVKCCYNNTDYYGYINSPYIESSADLNLLSDAVTEQTGETADFEAKLDKEGFPESYRVYLRALHEQYPLWEFKAFHTGLDWNTVLDEEGDVGENLLPDSYGVEWKSLEAGAYSWKTDTFTVFDAPSWVTASRDAIAYYMDPRNFLARDTVFQFEVLTYNPEYQTADGLGSILKYTAMYDSGYTYKDDLGQERYISFADTFIMAAEYSGVSPFHLASRAKQEISKGSTAFSNSATGTVEGYEGLYNFYNIGSYHSTVAGGAIINGLKFAKNGGSSQSVNIGCMIPWTSPFRSIVGGSFYIGNNYINRGQDTIYLQKFNTTATNTYGHQYMANVEAPYSEGKRVLGAYEEAETIPIVFSIPVYLNMPEEPAPKPEKAYNPNNWLKTLKVVDIDGSKHALTPTFDYTADREYSLIVSSDTDYLKFKTTTVSSLAKVISDAVVHPEYGLNTYTISVMAENGDIRNYTIYVVREEPEGGIGDDGGDGTGDEAVVPGDEAVLPPEEGGDGTGDGTGTDDGPGTGD